ncbi:putative membrane protein OS=Bosea thiooxidans OX=53254 GN=ARD30_12305 PE=4 SV=1 [Bosea thiooxidans]
MLTGSYRKRLEADLIRWVDGGLLSADSAGAIRRSVAREHGGFGLPALLGLLGGLLIASSVAAFVAANWEAIPRLAKLGMILTGIAVCFALAYRLERGGSPRGGDAATTCGVLIFAAGLALVGQMYHLPADWPGGSALVALGALAAAFLMRSSGALAIAFVAICAWSFGRWEEARAGAHFGFFILYLPALWLALSRDNRLIHHLAVLAGLFWIGAAPGYWLFQRFDYGLLAYGLAVSAFYVALGTIALDRGGPGLLTACLPWGCSGWWSFSMPS